MTSRFTQLLFCVLVGALASGACGPKAAPAPALPAPAVSTARPESAASATQPAGLVPAAAGASGAFVKEEVAVAGSYSLDPTGGRITFSDDFQVQPGPDLFVVLSGASDLAADYRTFGSLVTSSARVTLGRLTSSSGAQTYAIPAGADLAQFKTLVIWCESFSVAFAAAPMAAP